MILDHALSRAKARGISDPASWGTRYRYALKQIAATGTGCYHIDLSRLRPLRSDLSDIKLASLKG